VIEIVKLRGRRWKCRRRKLKLQRKWALLFVFFELQFEEVEVSLNLKERKKIGRL